MAEECSRKALVLSKNRFDSSEMLTGLEDGRCRRFLSPGKDRGLALSMSRDGAVLAFDFVAR